MWSDWPGTVADGLRGKCLRAPALGRRANDNKTCSSLKEENELFSSPVERRMALDQNDLPRATPGPGFSHPILSANQKGGPMQSKWLATTASCVLSAARFTCGALMVFVAFSGVAHADFGDVPEIDPGSIVSALTLLSGGVLMLTARRSPK